MISNLYAVRDVQAETFGRIFVMENDNTAKRAFTKSVTGDDPMSQTPDDFVLYNIGAYDDDTGAIDPCDPRRIASGLEMVKENTQRLAQLDHARKQLDMLQNEDQ